MAEDDRDGSVLEQPSDSFGATVDAFPGGNGSAVVFAPAAEKEEVMPHWPQTTPASTTAFALVKSA
jgi:hypothetical protein